MLYKNKNNYSLLLLLLMAGCYVLLPGVSHADEPLAVFTATERLSIDWPRTLVTYRVSLTPRKAQLKNIRLMDDAGREHPVQLSHVTCHRDGSLATAWVSFFAELPKDGRYSYQLVSGKPAILNHVSAKINKSFILLDNGKTAARLPAGEKNYRTPRMLQAEDTGDGSNASVPGPLQGVHLQNGTWTAPAYFWAANPASAPRVKSYIAEITANGPLFSEARIQYKFSNDGYYTLTARLLAGDSSVRIDEQMDLREIRPNRDWKVVVPLTDIGNSFRPDAVWWATPEGRLFKSDENFEDEVVKAGFTALPQSRRHLSSMIFNTQEPKQTLMSMAAWYPYAPVAYYAGLCERAGLKKQAKEEITFVGVMPMHAGNWRGIPESSNGDLLGYAGGRASIAWPLTVSPHPNTLLHTGEYDPSMPYSTIRRQWAYMAGPMKYHNDLLAFRRYDAYVNLDDYKDWVLEWPADAKITYPRLVTTSEHLSKVKENPDAHPMVGELKKLLSFDDDKARAKSLYTAMASDNFWSGARGHALRCLGRDAENMRSTGWVAGFRHSQKGAWTNSADELLSSQHITAEERIRLRAWIAACCYTLAEPDFNPRGTMVHLGNPNMPMNRFFGLTFAAALIPDHPEAKRWLDVSRQYLRYKLAQNTAPGGGWSELMTYYMSAASHVMQAAMVLDNQGLLDDHTAALAAQAGSFPMDLLSPRDPRFRARTYPAWGHEGHWIIPTQWLPVAAFMKKRNPELARDMVWAWNQLGRSMEDHHDAGFSPRTIIHADLLKDIKDTPPIRFNSKWIPGFGAVMRAHAGDPDETFIAYRQGYMVSHCDANQGDFTIYSKGVPLTSLSLLQYAIYNNGPYQKLYESFGWHNRVRFGNQQNTGGWPGGGPVSQVHRFFSSDSADYLRGVGDYAPQQWTRQLLFLKGKAASGPNYLLLRDSFAALKDGTPEQKWWYLGTDGQTTQVQNREDGFTYTSAWGPKLDVHLLAPTQAAVESRQATQKGPMYNRAAALWKAAGNPIEGTTVEETTTVTAVGPIVAGQDIMVALYPQGTKEELPVYQVIAPGAVKVTTSEGTDYAFLSRDRMAYTGDGITFSGRAGAVRLYKDEIHLVIAEGPGEISYGGVTIRSEVPVTKIIRRAQLSQMTVNVPVMAHDIRFIVERADAKTTPVQPGVTRYNFAGGRAWAFDSVEPVFFNADGVTFSGRRGGVLVDDLKGQVQLTMLDGERVEYNDYKAWGCDGPYTVTYNNDSITGRTAGLERFLYLTRPPKLDNLPTLIVDGQTYAPGTFSDFTLGAINRTGNPYDPSLHGGILIVPVMSGSHTIELKKIEQPAVFRNWQAWPQ